jgi:hypothetical protein
MHQFPTYLSSHTVKQNDQYIRSYQSRPPFLLVSILFFEPGPHNFIKLLIIMINCYDETFILVAMQRMVGTSRMPYLTWLVGVPCLKFLSVESTWEALTVCSVLVHRSFTAMISKNSLSILTHTYWFFVLEIMQILLTLMKVGSWLNF